MLCTSRSTEIQLSNRGFGKYGSVGGESLCCATAPQRGIRLGRTPLCCIFFIKGFSKEALRSLFFHFAGLGLCSWEGDCGQFPPQHFALSTCGRHLVAKDCILQLPSWKASNSTGPAQCQLENEMSPPEQTVFSELSVTPRLEDSRSSCLASHTLQ
jgi:hypothetical protein